MSAIVVGASAGLGRALACELAARGCDLVLVASDYRDVEALGADLALRHGVSTRAVGLDLARDADPGARIVASLTGFPAPTALLLAAGESRGDDDFSLGAAAIGHLLAVNLHAPLAIVHALLQALLETRGTIVLCGSIAAIRGRGRNVAYAAAKRALESVYESLRQRYRPRELRVQCYRLGFLATNLTWGRRLPLGAAEPAAVARRIVRRLRGRSGFFTAPRRFVLLAAIARWLPWPLYRRLRD